MYLTFRADTQMTRPLARAGMSPDSLRDFARHIVAGKLPADAARLAGFPDTARTERVMTSPHFQRARDEALEQLFKEDAPEMRRILRDIARDETTPARVRVDAATRMLDRAGFGAISTSDKARAAETRDKRPEDMTPGELAELIERLEREKSGRAVTVNEPPAGESDIAHFLA